MRAVVPLALLTSIIGVAPNAAAQFPSFSDEAIARGLSYVVSDGMFDGGGQFGCGVALCDLDGDGDDDIVATGALGAGTTSIALFRNDGGTFVNRTSTSGLTGATRVSGVVAGDYDGDVLNVISLKDSEMKEVFREVFSPVSLIIDSNNGKFNTALNLERDQVLGLSNLLI